MKNNAYTDDLYIGKNGRYYTAEYLNNNCRNMEEYTKVDDQWKLHREGIEVTCSYNQIFYPNSSLILCNNIVNVDGFWDGVENGDLWTYYDEDGNECSYEDAVDTDPVDVYQWFIIDNGTAEYLKDHTDEIVVYVESLDIYVLGVTHFGTAWDYVPATFRF